MPARTRVKSSMDMGNRSSIFISASHDKRNLWWRAFRQTVLDPHGITIVEAPVIEQIPEDLLRLVEDKCQNLERHESQVVSFAGAVSQGRGFASSILFPPEVLPPIDQQPSLLRCLEPAFDQQTVPSPIDETSLPLFDFPVPRPGLVSGFSPYAFDEKTLKHIPDYLTSYGCQADVETGHLHQDRAVYGPFLLFERTYGHARHEMESAMNFCAMDGSAALKGINLLYENAWPTRSLRPVPTPAVFSCSLDDDLGVINHHWMNNEGRFFVAPLCKFDFRDSEHFMHFLAWIEAIEEWAANNLLKDIREALVITSAKDVSVMSKALPSPVTDMEKQEKLNRSMKTAFENIPWKGERLRNIPLGVTSAMRMRSPKAAAEPETVITPMELNIPKDKPAESPKPQKIEVQPTMSPVASPAREMTPKPKPAPISLGSPGPSQLNPDSAVMSISGTPLGLPLPPPIPASYPSQERRGSASSTGNIRSTTPLASPAISRVSTTSTSSHSALPQSQLSTPLTSDYRNTPKPVTLMDAMPPPKASNTKSPGLTSPAYSTISVQSKRSFVSLRSRDKDKRIRSPTISESAASPRSINSVSTTGTTGFKSKISNGLGMIKEHTRVKRGRSVSDRSAPNSAKEAALTNPMPLPTPAYDKKRFEIRAPASAPNGPNSAQEPWLAAMKERAGAQKGDNAVDGNGDNIGVASTTSTPVAVTSPSSRPSTAKTTKAAMTAAYNAAHALPLRQWAKSPGMSVTQTTTITAGGGH